MQIYRSEDRGFGNHGWLKARFSFSFAEFLNPKMMNYGTLRVLNNDIIAPNSGFPNHSHNDIDNVIKPYMDGFRITEHTNPKDKVIVTSSHNNTGSYQRLADITNCIYVPQVQLQNRSKLIELLK